MDNSEQPLDLAKKALALAGGEIRYKHEFHSTSELIAMTHYNAAERARIAAIGPDVLDRIDDLICLLLAEALRPVILNSPNPKATLRKFLLARFFEPRFGWAEARPLVKGMYDGGGFNAEEYKTIDDYIDSMPYAIFDNLVDAVIPYCLIPKADADKLTGILVEMLKEAKNVDSGRTAQDEKKETGKTG
jgi:hypothetical protein